MKYIKQISLIVFLLTLTISCNSFLDTNPQGAAQSSDLNTPATAEDMEIAAYSELGNESLHTSYSLWPWGSMRSGDAYKGGDGVGDNSEWNDYETFVTNTTVNEYTDQMWVQIYDAISRVNAALQKIDNLTIEEYPNKTIRTAEMRFLRGHFYFMLKILYKYVPYFDETIPKSEYINISNRALSNDSLWGKIADDFRFAAANLPSSQTDVGRPNEFTADAYLAKTLLYEAYEQDENNNVISINQDLLSQVVALCDEVIKSGKYSLSPDFGDNFLTATENGPESVFAIQYSKNDGTPFGRIDMGHCLIYPMNPSFGCCWQHIPSQDLVNAFKTDANGLPMFNSYNNSNAVSDSDFLRETFDPRLDHTVAIPGHPYKYEPNFIYQQSWARSPAIYGYFSELKGAVAPDDPSFQKIPPFMSSSKDWELIRYSDVLLWKAEALIEMGDQNDALPIINQIRTRAAQSTSRLKQADGTYTSNYKVGLYQPGINCNWTQDYARQALRWERRLEFALEGNRFFDLVRWGIASDYLNAYFKSESATRPYLSTAHFTKGRDEYLPISQNQMNYSTGLYIQNVGW
jgi:hypothetical protein